MRRRVPPPRRSSSDLSLVLTERRQLGASGGVLERAITFKVTRLLTF